MTDQSNRSDLRSPEDIARFLPVVRSTGTLVVAVLGVILVCALGYLVMGRLPITVSGNAVVVSRYSVMALESSTHGRIESWQVQPGGDIRRDQVLALVGQPLLEKEIESVREELAELTAAQAEARLLYDKTVALERQSLLARRQAIEKRIEVVERESRDLRVATRSSIDEERKFFSQQEKELLRLKELESRQDRELKARLERARQLRAKELLTEEDLFAVREATTDQQVVLAQVDVKRLELNRSRIAAADRYLQTAKEAEEREQTIESLRQELLSALTESARLDQEVAEVDHQDRLKHARLTRHLDGLSERLRENSEIRSPVQGRVLELTVGEGAVVAPGGEIAVLDTREDSDVLEVVGYYPISAGKKIEPGMHVELLMPVPATGPGPATSVAATGSRTLLATVKSVSKLPVTPEAAALTIGNDYLAAQLAGAGSRIEVVAELQVDKGHPSGYLWSPGGGTEFAVAAGTTLVARTVIKRRPPLSFVVPALRDWQGF
ncbi:MAG TPA: NHLP bacteriocin system secretion protein [Gammaproteobacteria bacterium]|nr:NHLP bacteriocin system secretion protein [Gammaproteobacteria bacterium]